MSGRIIRQKFIKRGDLRANPSRIYVFGDNMVRRGLGGQAREMRGESNAIGVPTKWCPGTDTLDYFDDHDWQGCAVHMAIDGAFNAIEAALELGKDVVIPSDGLGTGLAELPTRAPKIHAYIEDRIRELEEKYR